MKKVLVLIGILASIVMIGCGESASGTDVTAGGKNSLNPESVKPNEQTGKSNGIADAGATPAPAGVKTGTPGG
jgi:hypothetical protein